MKVSNSDTIKAHGYDKTGRLISTMYDSWFTSIAAIIEAVKCKNPGISKTAEVSIYNEDTDEYGRYRIYPNSFKKI